MVRQAFMVHVTHKIKQGFTYLDLIMLSDLSSVPRNEHLLIGCDCYSISYKEGYSFFAAFFYWLG